MSILAKSLEWTQSFFGAIPFARIIYSLILVALIILIGRELLSVWDRGKIFLSDFSYFDAGVKKPEYGEQLRNETILGYGMMLDLIKRNPPKVDPANQQSDEIEEKSWWPQLTSWVTTKF